MKQIPNSKFQIPNFSAHTVFVLVLILVLATGGFGPLSVRAQTQSYFFPPFGGKILDKNFEVCLIPAPPPVFFIPIPFQYVEIGPPRPATLYYIYGLSRQYRRYSMEVSSWSLGLYLPEADDAFRLACANSEFLPDVDGVIFIIGTSCPEYNILCESS